MKVYECRTEGCTLGTPGNPGRFSGGATKQQITNLTGDPEPEKFGDGVCPNCGKPGVSVKDEPDPIEGNDPYDKFHKEVAARVADETDKLTAEDAQAELERLAEPDEPDDEDEEGES